MIGDMATNPSSMKPTNGEPLNTKQLYIGAAGRVHISTIQEYMVDSVSFQRAAHAVPISNKAEGKAYIQPFFMFLCSISAGPMPQTKAAAIPQTMNKTPAQKPSASSSISIFHLVVKSIIKKATILSAV